MRKIPANQLSNSVHFRKSIPLHSLPWLVAPQCAYPAPPSLIHLENDGTETSRRGISGNEDFKKCTKNTQSKLLQIVNPQSYRLFENKARTINDHGAMKTHWAAFLPMATRAHRTYLFIVSDFTPITLCTHDPQVEKHAASHIVLNPKKKPCQIGFTSSIYFAYPNSGWFQLIPNWDASWHWVYSKATQDLWLPWAASQNSCSFLKKLLRTAGGSTPPIPSDGTKILLLDAMSCQETNRHASRRGAI